MIRPDYPYLLSRKYVKNQELAENFDRKVAVHLHVFYVDLLEEFLDAFQAFHFTYDLWITTDVEEKKQAVADAVAEGKLAAEAAAEERRLAAEERKQLVQEAVEEKK